MKNKKAFFFTLTILFCITLLLLLSFSYRKEYTKESVKTRLLTANSFVEAIEGDAERAIYIAGYRTVLGLLDYVSSRDYIPEDVDYDDIFRNAFIDGNLTLEDYDGSRLLQGVTLSDWENETITRAGQFGLSLSFENSTTISVGQSDPWNIDMNLTLEYTLSDQHINSIWHREVTILGKIPIFSLEDPLYVQGFGEDVVNIIHKSPYTNFVDQYCNSTNFNLHINGDGEHPGSYYTNSSNAPNFLDRLKGLTDVKDEETGIESIINAPRINQTLFPERSMVDHSYFDCTECDLVRINGTSSWLFITSEEATLVYSIPVQCMYSV